MTHTFEIMLHYKKLLPPLALALFIFAPHNIWCMQHPFQHPDPLLQTNPLLWQTGSGGGLSGTINHVSVSANASGDLAGTRIIHKSVSADASGDSIDVPKLSRAASGANLSRAASGLTYNQSGTGGDPLGGTASSLVVSWALHPVFHAEKIITPKEIASFFSYIDKENIKEIKASLNINPRIVHTVNASYDTPLQYACEQDKPEIAFLLCNHGADPNQRVSHATSMFLLEYFTLNKKLDCMKTLLQCGACPHMYEQRYGNPPLRRAVSAGFVDGVRLLLAYGANPFTCLEMSYGHDGYTVPAWIKNQEIIDLLVANASRFR